MTVDATIQISTLLLTVLLLLGDDISHLAATQSTNEGSGNLLQYRSGDILIAGLMRVHRRGNELCSEIQEDGVQAVETMNMIIDQVNADTSILKGVKLGTIMIDTCDLDSHALRRVVVDILPLIWNVSVASSQSSGPRPSIPPALIAGVVGSASSAVSIQVANLLQVFKIPQVSYWSTSPDLSNKDRYKYFFRVVPSDTNQAKAMIAFVEGQEWNYISVVYEDDFYGVRGYTEIKDLAEKRSICIATAQSIPRSPESGDFKAIVENLVAKNAEAVIVFSKRNDASQLLLAAQDHGGLASKFIWIGSDGWARQIPMDRTSLLDSTVDGAVGFTPKTEHFQDLDRYISDITKAQNDGNYRNPWFAEYISTRNNCTLTGGRLRSKICSRDEKVNPATFKHLAKMESVADAVLSFVYSLNKYHKVKCKGLSGLCPQIARMIGTNRLADDLYPYLKNISFTGVNGRNIQFDDYQDGPAQYNILNFDAEKFVGSASSLEKWVEAGIYGKGTIKLIKSNLLEKVTNTTSVCSTPCGIGEAKIIGTEICCWNCQTCRNDEYVSSNETICIRCPLGSKPNDMKSSCSLLPITELSYDTVYGIACICLGSFGILCTTLVTGIYLVYRDTAIVKASGRELCFFVLFGIFATFLNFLPMIASPTTTTCVISRVILALGPTLMYAGLLTKTIRVVIIFQSTSVLSPKVRAFVRPWPQILCTIGVVFIQVIVLVIWFMLEMAHVEVFYPTSDIAIRACSQLVDLPLLYGLIYPFLLIIICTILATINRNVPTGFNEAQYIGFSMYTTCVIWLAFLPIFITNPSDLPQRIMTTSICLSLSATTILLCLFGPRCFTILFHPEENTQKSVISRDTGGTPASGQATSETARKTSEFNSNINNNNSSPKHNNSVAMKCKRWRNGLRYAVRVDRRSKRLRSHSNHAFDSQEAQIPQEVNQISSEDIYGGTVF